MNARFAILIGISIVGVIVSVIGWDTIRFNSEPRAADVRVAYKLGIQVAIVSSDLAAVKGGQIPKPIFKKGAGNPNSYIWSRAHLERPGDCLDIKQGQSSDPDCKKPSTLTPSPNRLVFSLLEDDSQKIGVHAKPLIAGQNEAFGAVYGVEGQVAIGHDFQSAPRFKIEIEGGLIKEIPSVGDIPDDDTIYNEGVCTAPSTVSLTDPFILASLPAGLIRNCTFTSTDNRRLVLLQHHHGLFQWTLATSTLHCKALLKTVTVTSPTPDFAGCLSANWNESASPMVTLVLFQSKGSGEWAYIR
jgi:hypothetical protein